MSLNATAKKLLFVALFSFLTPLGAQTRTYRIGVVPWVGWSPAQVAYELNLFKSEGVKVEVLSFKGPKEIDEAFTSGKLDFRYDFLGSVVARVMAGEKLKILAETDWSHGGDKIVIKKDEGFAKLPGAQVGVYIDSPAILYFLDLYLKREKLRFNDYKVVQMEPDKLANAFISNDLHLMINFDPINTDAITQGNGWVVANSAQFFGCMPEGIFAKTETLSQIPQEDLVKIMRGLAKAATWINDRSNWKSFLKILEERTFANESYGYQKLTALFGAVRIHDLNTLKLRNTKESGAQKYLLDLRAFLKENGLLKANFTPSEILDTSAMQEALR